MSGCYFLSVSFSSIISSSLSSKILVGWNLSEALTIAYHLYPLMLQGKIKVSEHTIDGFENMPKAFMGLFEGDNIGKVVVNI